MGSPFKLSQDLELIDHLNTFLLLLLGLRTNPNYFTMVTTGSSIGCDTRHLEIAFAARV